jgi:hypothetical protein
VGIEPSQVANVGLVWEFWSDRVAEARDGPPDEEVLGGNADRRLRAKQ